MTEEIITTEEAEKRRERKRIFKRLFMFFWNLLAEKGKVATIIGMIIALPINILVIIQFFTTKQVPDESGLWFLTIINAIGMCWLILPSSFIIEGPKLKIEVKD